MVKLPTFKDRFLYLKLSGSVGSETFGAERFLNQIFYKSPEWKKVRDAVILRDGCCDLGLEGFEIYGTVYIHHMNPITIDDVNNRRAHILDPEFLICTRHVTHNAIHYGDETILNIIPVERQPYDTCPWKN